MLRKVFSPKENEVSEHFRIVHNEEPYDLRKVPVVGGT
jgi:hypothetical protein